MWFRKSEREPTARCPDADCVSSEYLPIAPIMCSDHDGQWQVGAIAECFNCKRKFAVVRGTVTVPPWLAEHNRSRPVPAERQRPHRPPPQLETDLKWPG